MKLTLEHAMQALQAGVEHAKHDGGAPVAMTVVDANGFTVAAATMDNTPARVIGIARAKAYTAAKVMVSTEAFLQKLRDERLEPGWFCDNGFTPLPGGIPVHLDGVCVGAVGVSGRALGDDVTLATFITEALTAKLAG